MVSSTPSLDDKIDAICRPLTEFVSSYKASTGLSWVLIMTTIQTSIGNVYVQLLGKERARKRLEEIFITPFQKEFGPRQQTFDDAATLPVPYSQLPQFIIFNDVFSQFVKQLCTKHETDYVVTALIKFLLRIASDAAHPALAVKLLMQVCRDIQAGYYDLCEF